MDSKLGATTYLAAAAVFLILLSSPAVSLAELICPAPDSIYPCQCTPADSINREKLTCSGDLVDEQQVVNTLFDQVRLANNLSQPEDWLTLDSFYMFSTTLETLDLTPFAKTSFGQFYFFSGDLAVIVGGTSSSDEDDVEPFRFSVDKLTLDHARLTDAMLVEFFRFLHPKNLTLISLSGNLVEGSPLPGEFIEGISQFGQLGTLILYRNRIGGMLGGGQFKNNSRLTSLSLQNNFLTQLGQDAFLFNGPPDPDMTDVELYISLSDNWLNDTSFGPEDNGLVGLGRPVNLNLRNNLFEFISAANFQKILNDDERHSMNFFGNPFQCDERMAWLENAPGLYESRVFCVDCVNRDTNIFGGIKCIQN